MVLEKVFRNELAGLIARLIAKFFRCCVCTGTIVGKLSGLSWAWVGVTFGFVSTVSRVWWSVEIGTNDDTDGFSGSCIIAISFLSSIRASLIAFSLASAMAISFVHCIFLISLSRSKNVISVFRLAVLVAAFKLSERPELALEFTDVLLMEVFVQPRVSQMKTHYEAKIYFTDEP